MSTPLNHHYVSRCQIRKFFNQEGDIFLYDKSKENFYKRNSSKNIFSEKLSNSIYKDDEIDHETLEDDLKIFEDNYPKAVELITDTAKTLKISGECYQSLLEITMLGIIGTLRNPNVKRSLDDTADKMFDDLSGIMNEEQLKELERMKEYKKHVNYSNTFKYTETALRIAEKMHPIKFTIWHIQSDDYFLLPDTSAVSLRSQISPSLNSYTSEIAEVGFPLTDKIYIHALSEKLGQDKSYIVTVDKNNEQAVTDINYNTFHFAINTVATSNESYLRTIVKLVKDEIV